MTQLCSTDGVCQAWEWALNGYSTSGDGHVWPSHTAQNVPLCIAGRQEISFGADTWALCADLLDEPTTEGAVWAVGTASGGVLIVPSDDGEPIQLSPAQPSSGPVLQVAWDHSTASAHSALLLSVAGPGEVVLRRWGGPGRACSVEWASERGRDAVQSAAWCGQPGRFATGDAAGLVHLWDLARSRSGPVASVALRAPVRALRWIGPTECAPRPLLAAGDDRGEVALLAVSWH